MNAGQSLVTYAQPPELVQPGDRALDNPASLSQAAAVLSASFGKFSANTLRVQPVAVRLRVVAPITLNALGLVLRPSSSTGHRRNRLHQSFQLCDVVAIGFGEDHAQRNTLRLDERRIP